ncbi:MAG: plasmid stabilization protein [Acidobacteriia bacterium]|nr:plasmid stabilization protein [Terriglobia bacterium]
MASITIRNLNDEVMTRLRARAVANGRSLEEEAKLILRDAVGPKPSSRNLASIIRSHFGPTKGVDLELPSRE